MNYSIEQIFGADDNYIVLQLKGHNRSFIANVELYLGEDDIIENYFNINDRLEGTLAVEIQKSESTSVTKMYLEQGIYKFSSFSKLNCRITKKIAEYKYLAEIIDKTEAIILAKKSDYFSVGKTYSVEGYMWLIQDDY